MRLITPLGLIGLISLPVILLLHLFQRRQRRLIVSHLALWRFLRPQVHGPQARRIPITWLLILDLLAATIFSLALAGPQLVLPEAQDGPVHVVALLDISTSMLAEESFSSTRFDQAVAMSQDLLDQMPENGVFSLITFADQVRWVYDSRRELETTLPEIIMGLSAGETGDNLEQALALAKAIQDESLPMQIHVLTDGAFLLDKFDQSATPIIWHLMGTPLDNQAVMGLSVSRLSDAQVQVFVRLVNFAGETVQRDVVLSDGQGILGQVTVDLPAGRVLPQVWTVEAPETYVQIALMGSDALPEDDRAVFGLTTPGTVTVDLVTETPFPLDRAINILPETRLTVISPESYSPGLASGLTIFQDTLPDRLPAGVVLVLPPLSEEIDNPDLRHLGTWDYAPIPANAAAQVHSEEPVLAEIDFNGVRWEQILRLKSLPQGYEMLMSVSDEAGFSRPLLLRGREGNALVLVFLADLAKGNFTGHPAFPLLMHYIVSGVNQIAIPGALPMGQVLPLPSPLQFESLEIVRPDGATTGRLTTWEEIYPETLQPGPYVLFLEMPDGQMIKQVVGVNAGDMVESDLSPRDWTLQVDQPAAILVEGEEKIVDLVPWLLILGMLVLIGEAAISWR